MSPSLKQVSLLAIICTLIFSGCATIIQPTPTAIPTSTFTPTVTFTPTLSPTNTPLLTSTKLPSCDADQTIKNLKSKISYRESVVFYNKFQGTSFLVIWFVDPEINPTPKESEIAPNAELAIRNALILSQELNTSDTCISRLFDKINAVVVDKNYNGWVSGQISPTDLPSTVDADEKKLDEIAKLYQIGYLRDKVTAKVSSAPSNSCAWTDAKKNIQNHFSSERENVAFYYVLDDAGVNVWAQWDSQPEFLQLNLPASIMNVAMEIKCLFPEPDRIIFNIVDKSGEMQTIGFWNWADIQEQNLGQIQVVYQK
ncbi:MAG: hypothetical protein L6461_06920 [Anaerolineae bacterium]|jgi:hypothetical protein|nr:hypothetical protein [Anaerolineae bacterium]